MIKDRTIGTGCRPLRNARHTRCLAAYGKWRSETMSFYPAVIQRTELPWLVPVSRYITRKAPTATEPPTSRAQPHGLLSPAAGSPPSCEMGTACKRTHKGFRIADETRPLTDIVCRFRRYDASTPMRPAGPPLHGRARRWNMRAPPFQVSAQVCERETPLSTFCPMLCNSPAPFTPKARRVPCVQ